MEGTIGEIRLFAGNFAPRAWAFCEGQLLAINSNSALFSIIGTIYGGDGRSSFALPDLRGRVPLGPGTGPGLSSYREGQKGGVEHVTLTQSEIPSHNHAPKLHAETAVATEGNPTGAMLGLIAGQGVTPIYAPFNQATNIQMGNESITSSNVGGNQSHENRQPFLALYYIICLQGVFPSRN